MDFFFGGGGRSRFFYFIFLFFLFLLFYFICFWLLPSWVGDPMWGIKLRYDSWVCVCVQDIHTATGMQTQKTENPVQQTAPPSSVNP